ncbi:MAG: glycosyltransferase family 9 protein, partial [Candidatus Omnitrophota bacterium]
DLEAKIFIFAGPNERREINSIIFSLGRQWQSCYEFSDASLERLIALIDKCRLIVANDTGPLRFADALGKKIVALFGPVDERVYGPYPYDRQRTAVIKKDLSCRPCYRKFRLTGCDYDIKCLREITVDEVLTAAKQLIN